jgi:hypothetical protein
MANLPKIKTGDSSFDKIYAYFIDENAVSLSEKQEELKERWLSAWTLRLNFHSTEQAIKAHMEKYKIERAQTFRDLKNAETLFGNLLKTSIEGKRAIWAEYCHKYFLQALKSKDLKSQGKALDLLGKAWEVDKIESTAFNPEKLTNPQIKLKISKSTEQLIIDALTKTGVADFNKLKIEEAKIVEE